MQEKLVWHWGQHSEDRREGLRAALQLDKAIQRTHKLSRKLLKLSFISNTLLKTVKVVQTEVSEIRHRKPHLNYI